MSGMGFGLLRYVQRRKAKKPQKAKLPNEKIIEGGLLMLDPSDLSKQRKVYMVLTTGYLQWGWEKDSTPVMQITFADMVGVFSKSMTTLEKSGSFRLDTVRHGNVDLRLQLQENDFIISTHEVGHYCGRPFVFKAHNKYERDTWWRCILRVMKHYEVEMEEDLKSYHWFSSLRRRVRWIYLGDRCQIFIAGLIGWNFLMNILDAQVRESHGPLKNSLNVMEIVLNIIFIIELAINMFSTLVWNFCSDPWNWFDLVVVLVSFISMISDSVPGISVLRLARAFRVFRLFKRIESLKKIIKALSVSLPPMFNAFILVLLVIAIFSIMAVNFYGWDEAQEDNFANFFVAMFTMWQIATKSEWSDLVRDLFKYNAVGTGIFFVVFILIVDQILLNVVIATLLENFSNNSSDATNDAALVLRSEPDKVHDPFEGLSKELSKAQHLDDLEYKIKMVYMKVSGTADDEDVSNTLSFVALREGLLVLDVLPPCLFYEEDWQRLVVDRRLQDEDGNINFKQFMVMLKLGLEEYWKRCINEAETQPSEIWKEKHIRALMLGIKGRLMRSAAQMRELERIPIKKESPDFTDLTNVRDPVQLLRTVVKSVDRLNERLENIQNEVKEQGHDLLKEQRRLKSVIPAFPNQESTSPIPRQLPPLLNGTKSSPVQEPRRKNKPPPLDTYDGMHGNQSPTSFHRTSGEDDPAKDNTEKGDGARAADPLGDVGATLMQGFMSVGDFFSPKAKDDVTVQQEGVW